MSLSGLALSALVLALGVVFAISSFSKVRHPHRFMDLVVAYGLLPRSVARVVAVAVLALEVAVAFTLLTGWGVEVAVVTGLVLLLVFFGAVAVVLARGRTVTCGCFGDSRETTSPRTLGRLTLLIVAASAAVCIRAVTHETPLGLAAVAGIRRPEDAVALTVILEFTCALIVLGSWVLASPDVLQLWRRRGIQTQGGRVET